MNETDSLNDFNYSKEKLTVGTVLLSALYLIIAATLLYIIDLGFIYLLDNVVFDLFDWFNKLNIFYELLIFFLGGVTLFFFLFLLTQRISSFLGGLILDKLPKNRVTMFAAGILYFANVVYLGYLIWTAPTHFNFLIIVEMILLTIVAMQAGRIVLPFKQQMASITKNQ